MVELGRFTLIIRAMTMIDYNKGTWNSSKGCSVEIEKCVVTDLQVQYKDILTPISSWSKAISSHHHIYMGLSHTIDQDTETFMRFSNIMISWVCVRPTSFEFNLKKTPTCHETLILCHVAFIYILHPSKHPWYLRIQAFV